MKQKIIGTFYIGYEKCQLVLMEGKGGIFYPVNKEADIPIIKLGADYNQWLSVFSNLIHESFELVAGRRHCTYKCEEDLGQDSREGFFIMRHDEFSDICARVAEFINLSQRPLYNEWKKWGNEKKKKDKHK